MRELVHRARSLAAAHWAILLPALAYVSIFPYLPDLRSPNELCRLHQTRALVDHRTIEIGEVLRDFGPIGDLSCVALARGAGGEVVERRACPAAGGDPRFLERRFYPSKAPLLSFAAAPVYAMLKALRGGLQQVPEVPLVFFARLFCTVLPALLLLVPLRRFLRAQASTPVADALTATYALGTLAFSYAELFMSHQTTGVLLFLCFFALWRLRRGEWRPAGYALAGLLAGLAVFAEYTAALGLVPLGVYALATAPGGWRGRGRALALGLLGLLPAALALGWYHAAAFGHPFHSGYRYLNDAGYQGWHVGGFLGIRLPDARALALSFFSPLRGLLALSPFLSLALPGLLFALSPLARRFETARQRPELALAAGELALYAYFTSSFAYDSWGWTTGPRHLTPLVPFLLAPIAALLEATRSRWATSGLGAGLAAWSIVATSAMTFVNYIPDTLTNGLWQVAFPFLLTGHLPHSVLSILGVPNPWAALPAILAIAAAIVLVVRALLPADRRLLALAVALAAAALAAGAHALARPADEARRQRDWETYVFLEKPFVPRPGEASPAFWKAR